MSASATQDDMKPRLVSVEMAARQLGLQPVTIRSWAARRILTTVRLGRRRLVPVAEIDRLIDENTVPAVAARRLAR